MRKDKDHPCALFRFSQRKKCAVQLTLDELAAERSRDEV